MWAEYTGNHRAVISILQKNLTKVWVHAANKCVLQSNLSLKLLHGFYHNAQVINQSNQLQNRTSRGQDIIKQTTEYKQSEKDEILEKLQCKEKAEMQSKCKVLWPKTQKDQESRTVWSTKTTDECLQCLWVQGVSKAKIQVGLQWSVLCKLWDIHVLNCTLCWEASWWFAPNTNNHYWYTSKDKWKLLEAWSRCQKKSEDKHHQNIMVIQQLVSKQYMKWSGINHKHERPTT